MPGLDGILVALLVLVAHGVLTLICRGSLIFRGAPHPFAASLGHFWLVASFLIFFLAVFSPRFGAEVPSQAAAVYAVVPLILLAGYGYIYFRYLPNGVPLFPLTTPQINRLRLALDSAGLMVVRFYATMLIGVL